MLPRLLQVPFYRGERITFDVAPSRMNFKVEHNSLKLEVKEPFVSSIFDLPLTPWGAFGSRCALRSVWVVL